MNFDLGRPSLNCSSSKSSKLHVKYFKNGDRYDDGVNRSRTGNLPWAIDWHDDPWLWMALNCPRSRSREPSHEISWRPWEIQCWTQWRSYRKPSMGFRLAQWSLTLDDLELCWFKEIKITPQIFQKWWQNWYDVVVNSSQIGNHQCAIDRQHAAPPIHA